MKLINDFYIIESLGKDDIKDGKIFFETLKSIKKFNPKFYEVDSISQFKKRLKEFAKSKYKNLLISTHGDEENLFLKNDSINSYDLFDIDIDFQQKRVFISSCRGGSFLIAKYFMKMGAYSVIGTPDDLDQIVAVAFWPTMLILFGRLNDFKVKFSVLDKSIKELVRIYQIPIHYYSFVRNENKLKEYIYKYGKRRKRTDYSI